ncbi:MAG: ABC transporter permease [Candidatus Altiarchaeota archaeon]|nr:ABC transporter permease [Candidatus Altiarchaeota archaeon]
MAYWDMTFGELWRHKTRTALTAFGLILAIAAIVSLGSISEGINSLVMEQLKLAAGFITVSPVASESFGPPSTTVTIDTEIVSDIEAIDGVKEVARQLMVLDPQNNYFMVGVEFDKLESARVANIDFVDGDWPDSGTMEVVFGNQQAQLSGVSVGDDLKINNEDFTVAGILEMTNGFMDYGIITSYETLSEVFDKKDEATMLLVEPFDIGDAKRIANEINEVSDLVQALTPEQAVQRAEEAVNQIRALTLVIGIVASIVASIGIINTMIMTVMERKRELGIMKALGAERFIILRIVFQDAIVIAIIGGTIGMLFGILGTEALNTAMAEFPVAKVTPELAGISFIYGIILSILASLYPAYQAVIVNPVEAMRQE